MSEKHIGDEQLMAALQGPAVPEVPAATRRQIIGRQRELWANTLEDARLGYQTGVALGDQQTQEQAKAQARRALLALEHLQAELAALPQ